MRWFSIRFGFKESFWDLFINQTPDLQKPIGNGGLGLCLGRVPSDAYSKQILLSNALGKVSVEPSPMPANRLNRLRREGGTAIDGVGWTGKAPPTDGF